MIPDASLLGPHPEPLILSLSKGSKGLRALVVNRR